MNGIDWKFEEKITANFTEFGNCSACCFRNWPKICKQMTCQDKDFNTVFWTVHHGMESEATRLWVDYIKTNPNVKEFCLREIAKAHQKS